MKKEYSVPEAEKIEFNYTETVVASHFGCGDQLNNAAPGSGGWVCPACDEKSFWIDAATGKCKKG